jgi:molybdopterin biosynthesis enzyme
MITFDEALARVIELARPLGTEHVPLAEARGRVQGR